MNQPEKISHIFFISGKLPGLSQTDKKPVAVKLPDKFRILIRYTAPVHILPEGHGFTGSFHIPVQIKQEGIFTYFIRDTQNMLNLFFPVFPAVRCGPLRIRHKIAAVRPVKKLFHSHFPLLLFSDASINTSRDPSHGRALSAPPCKSNPPKARTHPLQC